VTDPDQVQLQVKDRLKHNVSPSIMGLFDVAAEPMPTRMIEDLFSRRARNSLGLLRSPRQDLGFEQLRIFYQEAGFKLNDQFASNLELLGSGVPRILQNYYPSVFHFTENFLRIVLPFAEGYSAKSDGEGGGVSGGVSGGVNPELEAVLDFVARHPGCRLPAIIEGLDMAERTVERHLQALRKQGRIEFAGAPKTGGYRVKQSA